MVEGVRWKWTGLPVLARLRRSVNGTSTPCGNGCLAASRRAARRASGPCRRLAVAWMAGPVGRPRAVDGEAHRGAHRSAVPAVGGHQHRLLADEPGQHRAGGWGDLTDDPAEPAPPHRPGG